jgi:hypothetical protein
MGHIARAEKRRIQMKKLTLVAFAASLAVATTAQAAFGVVGADEGHVNGSNCGFATFNGTPAVSCTTSSAASGTYNWQVPMDVSGALFSSVTLSASFTGTVPSPSSTNQRIDGRLLAWSAFGVLLCSTAGSTLGVGGSSASLGSCTFDPGNTRPEAEFYIGHVNGHSASADPRVIAVQYSM